MNYAVGVDGGGTKTAILIAEENGSIVHRFVAGAINYNGLREETVNRHLKEMVAEIDRICGGIEHCACICIGAAGIGNPLVPARLKEVISASGYKDWLIIKGDQETALSGALEQDSGIILIAGTGSICYGKNGQGFSYRTGGMGHLIDDGGSGYSIGRALLAASVKAADGRIAATVITKLIYEQLRISTMQELVGFVYDKETSKRDIAALAPILTVACSLGDEAARHIAAQAADDLHELVVPVVERLELHSGKLALAGGVLLHNREVQQELVGRLKQAYPGLRCAEAPQDAAAQGALRIALEQLRAAQP